jgi:hypothetical protein
VLKQADSDNSPAIGFDGIPPEQGWAGVAVADLDAVQDLAAQQLDVEGLDTRQCVERRRRQLSRLEPGAQARDRRGVQRQGRPEAGPPTRAPGPETRQWRHPTACRVSRLSAAILGS